ncbi:MAG: hypothetical protein ABSF25_18735 [Bryobacteraceae bacterium]
MIIASHRASRHRLQPGQLRFDHELRPAYMILRGYAGRGRAQAHVEAGHFRPQVRKPLELVKRQQGAAGREGVLRAKNAHHPQSGALYLNPIPGFLADSVRQHFTQHDGRLVAMETPPLQDGQRFEFKGRIRPPLHRRAHIRREIHQIEADWGRIGYHRNARSL